MHIGHLANTKDKSTLIFKYQNSTGNQLIYYGIHQNNFVTFFISFPSE